MAATLFMVEQFRSTLHEGVATGEARGDALARYFNRFLNPRFNPRRRAGGGRVAAGRRGRPER
jgi:hypothetical protein